MRWYTCCNRCIVVDLCCDCEACSLDAPGVVTPDTAPDISEPTQPSSDPYPASGSDICEALVSPVNSMVEYEEYENPVYKNGADIESQCAIIATNDTT